MDDSWSFSFDSNVYSLTTIKKAALHYSAHFSLEISVPSKCEYVVQLVKKSMVPFAGPDASCFPNSVLEQDLRDKVAKETESTVQLLLAQAFSNLELTDPTSEHVEIGEDPHGIASVASAQTRPLEGQ